MIRSHTLLFAVVAALVAVAAVASAQHSPAAVHCDRFASPLGSDRASGDRSAPKATIVGRCRAEDQLIYLAHARTP